MKGKKFDIQFTFNRLPVQMEHRACANIVKNRDMCHVLFPEENSLDLRGEMNYAVRLKKTFLTTLIITRIIAHLVRRRMHFFKVGTI